MDARGDARDVARTGAVSAMTYLPWLDGLRAVSVMAVVGEHENLIFGGRTTWMKWLTPAGFVGVDVFFVISGFLITSLLLREWSRRGRIDFVGFYQRRARRLFPALGVLLVAVVGGAILFEPHRRHLIVGYGIETALYSANWFQAFASHGPGAGAAPSTHLGDLGHAWSLACEEQFYLLWPALLAGLGAIGVRGRKLVIVLGFAALVALAYPVLVAQRGWWYYRIYNGLDTHCAGLVLGSLLGAAWTLGWLPTGAAWTTIRRVSGLIAGALLLWLMESGITIARHVSSVIPRLHIFNATYSVIADSLAASVLTVIVIWAIVEEPPNVFSRALAWGPVRELGRISYGVYLYSVPIQLLLTPHFVGTNSVAVLVVLHIVVSIAAAALSFVTIERYFNARRRSPVLVAS